MSDIHRVPSHASGREDEPKTPTGTWLVDASRSGSNLSTTAEPYKVSKSRFIGLSSLNNLNLMATCGITWFVPILSILTTQFGFTSNQINMLPNVSASMYFPTCLCVPWLASKYGMGRCCEIGTIIMVLGAWLRYASVARGIPNTAAYALLVISQLLTVVSISIFQVLGPKYSESWFNLNGRTTATMIIAISYFAGQGTGPMMAPWFKDTRLYILALAILITLTGFSVFKLRAAEPPIPPTYAASQKSRTLKSLLLNLVGKAAEDIVHPPMTKRERLDFTIIMHIFSLTVAGMSTFMTLIGVYLVPYGYSISIIKHTGFALIGPGTIGALISAPLLDRVFKSHLAVAMKILASALAAGWLSLAWAIQPDNTIAIMIIVSVVSISSMSILAIALELAVEVTRAPLASTALLWGMAHLVTLLFINLETVLQTGPEASPPNNMRNGLVFQAAYICISVLFVIPLKGEQKRRKMDERAGKPIVGIPVQSHSTETRDRRDRRSSTEMIELV